MILRGGRGAITRPVRGAESDNGNPGLCFFEGSFGCVPHYSQPLEQCMIFQGVGARNMGHTPFIIGQAPMKLQNAAFSLSGPHTCITTYT